MQELLLGEQTPSPSLSRSSSVSSVLMVRNIIFVIVIIIVIIMDTLCIIITVIANIKWPNINCPNNISMLSVGP